MDLNADLGEGMGEPGSDEALLDIVTSANIACGFHAGDPSLMRRTIRAALDRGVVIGAHVSYPDRKNFGRLETSAPPPQIEADVLYQVAGLGALATAAGGQVRYVKPHGALYHRIARDEAAAAAVVRALRAYDQRLLLMTLPGSVAARIAADAGIGTVAEGFADRAYTEDGTLLPRDQPGAVLTEDQAVIDQAIRLASSGRPVVHSICVHGDTPGAVQLAKQVRTALAAGGLPVRSFLST
jgi:5-oxoprolinase (ATP-hydrolysing) subunit A